jgi:hypothetical protein
MQHQRWFIIGAFIVGAIISPTPDVRNQLVLTGPIILMYELGIVMIWLINRKHHRPRKVVELLHKDSEAQSERLASFEKARTEWRKTMQAAHPAPPRPVSPLLSNATEHRPSAGTELANGTFRPRKYVQDFTRQPRSINPQTPQAE